MESFSAGNSAAVQQHRAGGALADAATSYRGLWRTYARVGYAAPSNRAEHLPPSGACSALLASAEGGRAKPRPQPAPVDRPARSLLSASPQPPARAAPSSHLTAHRHHHGQQHDWDLHRTIPGLLLVRFS